MRLLPLQFEVDHGCVLIKLISGSNLHLVCLCVMLYITEAVCLAMHGLCGTAFGMSVICLLCVLPCAHSLISCTAGYGSSFATNSDYWVRPDSRIGYAVDYSGSTYAYQLTTSSASVCAQRCTGGCDTFLFMQGHTATLEIEMVLPALRLRHTGEAGSRTPLYTYSAITWYCQRALLART